MSRLQEIFNDYEELILLFAAQILIKRFLIKHIDRFFFYHVTNTHPGDIFENYLNLL